MQRIQKIKQKKITKSRVLKTTVIIFIIAAALVALLELTNKTHLFGDKPQNTGSTSEQPVPGADNQVPPTGGEQGPQPQPEPKPDTEYPRPEPTSYTTIAENEQYSIKKADDSETYLVTLYAIINRPDQYDMYQQQLKEYKTNALNYLHSKGVNTGKVTIKYEPEEATEL